MKIITHQKDSWDRIIIFFTVPFTCTSFPLPPHSSTRPPLRFTSVFVSHHHLVIPFVNTNIFKSVQQVYRSLQCWVDFLNFQYNKYNIIYLTRTELRIELILLNCQNLFALINVCLHHIITLLRLVSETNIQRKQ